MNEHAISEIQVTLRPGLGDGPLKAWADVRLHLRELGSIRICDCSVIQPENKPAFVAYPSRKGKSRYFPQVEIEGKINSLITQAVMTEYQHSQRSASAPAGAGTPA